ncbi:MAG: hypothetical protein ACN793_00675 [Buchnera aphidicola (Eriosoma harunire)]
MNKKQIDIKQLIEFWKNPILFFFKKILKIKIPYLIKKNNYNYFHIEKNKIYFMKYQLLNALIYLQNTCVLYKQFTQLGILPHGNFGMYIWDKINDEIYNLSERIQTMRKIPKQQKISININEYQLYNFQLNEIHPLGLIRWKPHKINFQDKISLWIEHLIYCYFEKSGHSYLFGTRNSRFTLSNMSKERAIYYLNMYIIGYEQGIRHPLMLTQSGITWINYTYTQKHNNVIRHNNNDIKQKYFYNIWNGNILISGEKNNIFIKKIIPKINNKTFNNLCKIAKIWLTPILNYSKSYKKK